MRATESQKFGIDQLVAASEAARNFATLRKSAKIAPRLILENNKPDSVIMSIESYQHMQNIIMQLEEELFELQTRMRIENVEINGVEKQKFEDFATDEDRKIVQAAMKWDVSDEDLFE